MVDAVRAATQQSAQIQSNAAQSTTSAQKKPTPTHRDSDSDARSAAATRTERDTSSTQTRAVKESSDSADTSEDLRERALQLLDKQAANSSNAGSSSIRRGSVLDITA